MLPGNIFNRHEDVNVREIEHAASLGASASSYRAPSGYQRCRLRYVIKTIASTHTPTVNIVTGSAHGHARDGPDRAGRARHRGLPGYIEVSLLRQRILTSGNVSESGPE